jgi:uncharacterized protein (DUF1697 family)
MMNTYISMLRGINVGGHNQIRMAELKKLYEDLGFEAVETYVQSGNVVFRSPETDAGALARRIETRLQDSLGSAAPVLVREPCDFERIMAHNPFLTGRSEEVSKLHVMFLSAPADPARLASLVKPADCLDEFIPGEQEIFLFCPGGLGRTKLTTAFFERKLKLFTTTRNWNTIHALLKLSTRNEPHS